MSKNQKKTETTLRKPHSPAVGNDGSSVRRVAGLYPTEEGKEGGRVLRYTVVGPRRELELANLPLLAGAILERTERWI